VGLRAHRKSHKEKKKGKKPKRARARRDTEKKLKRITSEELAEAMAAKMDIRGIEVGTLSDVEMGKRSQLICLH